MDTGCSNCDKHGLCNKHKLEYLKYEADKAQLEYLEELKAQSKKGTRKCQM